MIGNMIITNERKAYAIDLTDSQWEIIKPLMWKDGNKSKWEKRELINAVLYLVDSGCKWAQLHMIFHHIQQFIISIVRL